MLPSVAGLFSSRVPPITTALGQACFSCFKEDVVLSKCAKCLSVQYCGPACQKVDWNSHKAMCKALHSLERDGEFKKNIVDGLSPKDSFNFMGRLFHDALMPMSETHYQLDYLSRALHRPLKVPERNMICWEPSCMACGRNNRMIRVETASAQGALASSVLTPCPDCKMAFTCSENHKDEVWYRHTEEPCEGGHDGLSQCQMNQEIREDIAFANKMAKINPNEFTWAPERVKTSWESLKDTTWDIELAAGISRAFEIPTQEVDVYVRGATVALSMPLTILWAFEHLYTDDQWARKEALTIHVLGAYMAELLPLDIFEDILHRLPLVKTLNLVLVGPELLELVPPDQLGREFIVKTCSKCATRKFTGILFAQPYHDYARAMGRRFVKPDLAVAFNSGMSQEDKNSWKETLQFLIKNKIPSVFTAYNEDEAEDEAILLEELGASLVPALGPLKNPWGSTSYKTEPGGMAGVYSVNNWLAGGFR